MEVMGRKKKGFSDFLKENYEPEGFIVSRFANLEDGIIISLGRKKRHSVCPSCGKAAGIETLRKKMIRDLDLIKRCYIEFGQAKIRCRCGYRGVERLDFVGRHSRYTRRFEEYAASLANAMSFSDAARICGIDWKTARQMFYRARRPP